MALSDAPHNESLHALLNEISIKSATLAAEMVVRKLQEIRPPELWTREQVRKYLGISHYAMRRLIENGSVKPITFAAGNKYLQLRFDSFSIIENFAKAQDI